jgi:predicted acetyltransferase
LERGWSADNLRPAAAREELARIEADARAFVAAMEDREAKGPSVTLPDGSVAKRLPCFRRWLWDGEFCGSISLRWQKGTPALPPNCLGHIGYGGVLVEHFVKPPQFGGKPCLRFRVSLT